MLKAACLFKEAGVNSGKIKKLIGTMNVVTAYWKRGSIVEDSFLARNSTRKIFVEAYRDYVSRVRRDKVLYNYKT